MSVPNNQDFKTLDVTRNRPKINFHNLSRHSLIKSKCLKKPQRGHEQFFFILNKMKIKENQNIQKNKITLMTFKFSFSPFCGQY